MSKNNVGEAILMVGCIAILYLSPWTDYSWLLLLGVGWSLYTWDHTVKSDLLIEAARLNNELIEAKTRYYRAKTESLKA